MNMIWRGDKVQNYGSRLRAGKKYAPTVIVDHISAGTMGSMYNWFTSPNNTTASSHFGVGRDGSIHQYVRLEHAAWTQGLTTEAIPKAIAAIVKRMGVNPNLYCVGIEHEGYVEGHMNADGKVEVVNYGLDGDLTEAQFWSSCWLHKYIQEEVQRIWGNRIVFTPEVVLGHFQIDPIRKPFCPGSRFPWSRLYSVLAKAENMMLEEFEEYIEYQKNGSADYAKAYAAVERARDLGNKLSDPKWGGPAEAKLLWLTTILPVIGYKGEVTAAGIVTRLIELYDTLIKGGKYAAEALRKLLIVYTEMKSRSLL